MRCRRPGATALPLDEPCDRRRAQDPGICVRNSELSRTDPSAAQQVYSAFTQTDLDATCRVHCADLTGQHTGCCCRRTSYDAFARGITVVAVSDAAAVYEPFAAGRYQQARDVRYLRT